MGAASSAGPSSETTAITARIAGPPNALAPAGVASGFAT